MIEETLLEKKKRSGESFSLKKYEITEKFKFSCISAVRKALHNECKRGRYFDSNEPMTIIVLECATFCGKTVGDILFPDELERLLGSINGELFLDTLENIAYEMKKRDYCYNELEKDLNLIFKRNEIPIKCNKGQFIDGVEKTTYKEIVSPCFSILSNNDFETADKLLREAFEKYRECENKEAILKCGLALDSVLDKIMVDVKLEYPGKNNDFHGRMTFLREHDLLPNFYDESFGRHLEELLHMPLKIRNNEPNVSHGKADNTLTDNDLVKYTLDVTASSILYIVREFLKYQK